jgi:ribosomal protein S1
MSQNKTYAVKTSDNKNTNSATPYKRKYAIDLLLEVDPFFLEEGELEAAVAEHNKLAQLLEDHIVPLDADRKDFVTGTVVAQTKEGYFVNIGRKYDGFVPLTESDDLTIGQEAEFYVVSSADKNGIVTISSKLAKGWRKLEAAQGSLEIFTARVFSEAIKKRTQQSAGLRIQFEEGDFKGIRGFIPNGEIARNSRSKELVGKTIEVTVIKAEPQHGSDFGNLVVSHKGAQSIADEISFNAMETDAIVVGNIIGFLKAGVNDSKMSALVQLENGLVGMLHRSETVEAQDSLPDMYKVGDQVTVAVRHIDHNKKRIGLSLKLAAQMQRLASIYPNAQVEATILRQVVYGYFASVGGGLEGLIHQSDLATRNTQEGVSKESFQPGQVVKVLVLSMEADGKRLALGRKQLIEKQIN